MKTVYIILIVGIIVAIGVLGFMLVFPVLVWKMSWWWFFGALIIELGAGGLFGVIYLITHASKDIKKSKELSKKSARKLVINDCKNDEDNPDNFMIIDSQPMNIGEKGTEKTPMILFSGIGTEMNSSIYSIINLNNKKISRLTNPKSTNEIKDAINKLADHPPEEKDEIETRMEYDKFGRQVPVTVHKKVSAEEKRKEEEKKQEEALSGM